MPTVSTWIDAQGTVTVTVESDPETDGLAYLALEAIAQESAARALALWREVNPAPKRPPRGRKKA